MLTVPPEPCSSFWSPVGKSIQNELQNELKIYSKDELGMVMKYRDEYRAKHKK